MTTTTAPTAEDLRAQIDEIDRKLRKAGATYRVGLKNRRVELEQLLLAAEVAADAEDHGDPDSDTRGREADVADAEQTDEETLREFIADRRALAEAGSETAARELEDAERQLAEFFPPGKLARDEASPSHDDAREHAALATEGKGSTDPQPGAERGPQVVIGKRGRVKLEESAGRQLTDAEVAEVASVVEAPLVVAAPAPARAARGDIGAHIREVLERVGAGQFVSCTQLAREDSAAYPQDARRPSVGAIQARLFPRSGKGCTVEGVAAVEAVKGDHPRGARLS